MGEAAWVVGDHASVDIVPAEEVSPVVEQHFVVIVIVVVERYFQSIRITFYWPRHKGTNHEPIGDKGGVCRRWEGGSGGSSRA